MTLKDYVKDLDPDFSVEKCYSLVLAAKSVKSATADNVYGIVVVNYAGEVVYKVYFGEGVPDSSLAYDRVKETDIFPDKNFPEAYEQMRELVSKRSILFSAGAGTWANKIFESIADLYPAVNNSDCYSHVDIVKFCTAVDSGLLPGSSDLVKFSMRSPITKRQALDKFAWSKGITNKPYLEGPLERATYINELVRLYFDKEVKTPK